MARININPTRASLSGLKKNLATATKGHRLLKDKRDELMRRLLEIAKEAQSLREKTDSAIIRSKENLGIAAALMGEKELYETLIMSSGTGGCKVTFRNVMSVTLPEFQPEDTPAYTFGFAETPAELYMAIKELVEIKNDLFRLSGLEKAAAILSAEIERVGRRVNALEYVLIPDYQDTIRYIKMRLEENERANSIRLLKVKDMVIEEKRKGK